MRRFNYNYNKPHASAISHRRSVVSPSVPEILSLALRSLHIIAVVPDFQPAMSKVQL